MTGYSKAELLAMPLSALFCAAGTDDSDKQVGTALSERRTISCVLWYVGLRGRSNASTRSTGETTTDDASAASGRTWVVDAAGKRAFRRLHKAALVTRA
ncbi:hypothetical protein C8039_20015 [Halogeometricum sp. wsp3]|nr:hypothetical protein C8039_20015 [Halogeometricum sp. wsp3]